MWYVVPTYPPRPYPTWTVTSNSRERRCGGDEEQDGIVGEEVKFGESKGGGQKSNSGGSGDGGSNNKDDDEVCKDGKGNSDKAAVDSFLVTIVKGYSHCDTENHQDNISHINEEIVFRSKLETKLSDTRK